MQTSSVGIDGKSWKSSNGAGSSLRECAKLIESGIANSRLALRRMAPPTSVLPSPKEVVDPSQRGHSRGDQRINPGREDVGYCPSRTLLCRGCECRTACFLSEDGSATTNSPNSQPAMISAMSPPEPQLIQIDRDDQGHEESDSNHDIPASSQRQSELELSLHFPLPLSPDNLLHNSNN